MLVCVLSRGFGTRNGRLFGIDFVKVFDFAFADDDDLVDLVVAVVRVARDDDDGELRMLNILSC